MYNDFYIVTLFLKYLFFFKMYILSKKIPLEKGVEKIGHKEFFTFFLSLFPFFPFSLNSLFINTYILSFHSLLLYLTLSPSLSLSLSLSHSLSISFFLISLSLSLIKAKITVGWLEAIDIWIFGALTNSHYLIFILQKNIILCIVKRFFLKA